jgi:hypothetical protein
MKRNILISLSFIVAAYFLLGANGCGETSSQGRTGSVYTKEQMHTVDNQARLYSAQPPIDLSWSLERDNINKRTNLWNNPNKVSYIYLVNYGKVMAFFTIKGKVSSVNSQITNTQQIVDDPWHPMGHALPSPAEDGSYGSNGDAIFFFTTEGAYVEWKGDYMLSDYPLKLATPPELVRQIASK